MNNSSTGGPIVPNPLAPPIAATLSNLTLKQFIQTVLVGISGFPQTLVRPEWQQEAPKQPDINIDWLAYGIQTITADDNAYEGEQVINNASVPFLQRNELLPIQLQVYGPNCYENTGLIRDGFQLTQNLASLKQAKMGFGWDEPAQHSPDLVNGRWFDRYIFTIYLRRQIQRQYPILSFVSATGIIHTSTAEDLNFSQNWEAGE